MKENCGTVGPIKWDNKEAINWRPHKAFTRRSRKICRKKRTVYNLAFLNMARFSSIPYVIVSIPILTCISYFVYPSDLLWGGRCHRLNELPSICNVSATVLARLCCDRRSTNRCTSVRQVRTHDCIFWRVTLHPLSTAVFAFWSVPITVTMIFY